MPVNQISPGQPADVVPLSSSDAASSASAGAGVPASTVLVPPGCTCGLSEVELDSTQSLEEESPESPLHNVDSRSSLPNQSLDPKESLDPRTPGSREQGENQERGDEQEQGPTQTSSSSSSSSTLSSSSLCAIHSSPVERLKEQSKQLLLRQQKRRQQLQELQQEQERRRKRDPFEPQRIIPKRHFHLYAGSQFRGKQQSGTQSYDVQVNIKYVDLEESFLCGYLLIEGLTEDYPELTTYFEAEIIGPKYSFFTKRWDADERIDEEHWMLFPPFEDLAGAVFGFDVYDNDFTRTHFNHNEYDFRRQDVIFMRWKEHFLVPDHRIQGINGASFAGFYYICYNKVQSTISGFYYHQSSEKFQQLNLTHVPDQPSTGSFEFR
ncbi:hypothetical protein BGW38_002948 [Lunasporangiospora selenospora]|uniref:Vacuolar import and degradation protein n=1 Tax=Lunasporangiospora selenospora TaxID=979761 RepID=A0A9P6KH36_9FUNG|nr:hypothetical protein BGW38_002948 [Lunasporangiospora selenospora]